ncbi:Ribonuclease H-like superfamily [Sesbania bispinosa]|nr:Ribonuclease H-like superfamily [Sesbania bispinosa]
MMMFNDCKILMWNCRGGVHSSVRGLVKRYRPIFCIMVETHCAFQAAKGFWRSLGYESHVVVEAVGHSGVQYMQALALLFVKFFGITYLSYGIVSVENCLWKLAQKFAQVLEDCRLMDIGAIGGRFTWFRREQNGRSISKRLDRVLADCDWRLRMPNAFVEGFNKLWVRFIKAKYISSGSILSATSTPGASYIWNGIVKAKEALKEGFAYRLGMGDTSMWLTDWTGFGRLCDMVPFVHISDRDLVIRDLVVNNRWCFDQRKGFLSGEPTSAACARCSQPSEGILHCLRDCPHSLEIWMRIGMSGPLFYRMDDVSDWLETHLRSEQGTIFLASIWWIWHWRNNMCLDTTKWRLEYIIRDINLTHDDFIRFLGPRSRSLVDNFREVLWVLPSADWVKVNVDGSFFPDSLRMGVGGIIRDAEGNWVSGFSGFIGVGDSLEAEFEACRFELEVAWDIGLRYVIMSLMP